MDGPEIQITEERFNAGWLVAVVPVGNGRGQGALKLLLALHVPASKEKIVVFAGWADSDTESPGKGYGIAKSGCDALSSNCDG